MSTLQVDRIEPYQSASVTIVGLDVDTTALNQFTASQETINTNLQLATASLESSVTNLNGFTASQEVINTNLNSFTSSQEVSNATFATTGSNTFQANQTVNGHIQQNFGQPSNSQLPLNNITGTFTIPSTGAPYNYVQNSFAGYGFGNAYNGWLWESWDSLSFNYGSDTSINASGFYTLVQPSGSSNAFNAELRVRDNYDGTTTSFLYGTTLLLGNQKTNTLEIGNSGLTSVISGSVSVEKILTLAPQDPLPSGAVGQVAVSGSNLYFYTDQWKEVAFV